MFLPDVFQSTLYPSTRVFAGTATTVNTEETASRRGVGCRRTRQPLYRPGLARVRKIINNHRGVRIKKITRLFSALPCDLEVKKYMPIFL